MAGAGFVLENFDSSVSSSNLTFRGGMFVNNSKLMISKYCYEDFLEFIRHRVTEEIRQHKFFLQRIQLLRRYLVLFCLSWRSMRLRETRLLEHTILRQKSEIKSR